MCKIIPFQLFQYIKLYAWIFQCGKFTARERGIVGNIFGKTKVMFPVWRLWLFQNCSHSLQIWCGWRWTQWMWKESWENVANIWAFVSASTWIIAFVTNLNTTLASGDSLFVVSNIFILFLAKDYIISYITSLNERFLLLNIRKYNS